MRKVLVLAAVTVLATATAVVADAKPRGTNGQIVFARFNPQLDPELGDTQIYTTNPDGSHERVLDQEPLGGPRWSPDGMLIATGGGPDFSATALFNPDDGTFRSLLMPDPDLFTACNVWTPDGARLACESFGFTDPNRNGIYTIRSTDGQGLTRLTVNPGGDDQPGDYSPDGSKLVFSRYDPDGNSLGLFIVNKNGNSPRQIAPGNTALSSTGSWSPQGNEIVFSQRATSEAFSSLWLVHSDGTALRELNVEGCGAPLTDPSATSCWQPSWSPDATKIAFTRGRSEGLADIYTVNADGSGLTQVTHTAGSQQPDWGTHPLAHS